MGRNSPGYSPATGTPGAKVGMESIGRSPFAAHSGAAQTGVTQAAAAEAATVTTTVVTKVEPPPRPQVFLPLRHGTKLAAHTSIS